MPVNIGVNIQRSPNRINQQLREAGVEGKFPKLLLDFKDQYYLASGGSKTLANAVTHSRSGNAVMTDGYGPELVTNGGFTGNADNWTLVNSTYRDNAVDVSTTSAVFPLSQTGTTAVSGKSYVVTFQIRDYQGSGAIKPSFGGVDGTFRSANGYHTEVITATGTGYLLFKTGGTAFTGTIDNVSVREMPVLKWAPHNLLPTPDNFSNTAADANVTSGQSDPDGGTDAFEIDITSAGGDINHGVSVTSGIQYSIDFIIKPDSTASSWIRVNVAGVSNWFEWDNGWTAGTTGTGYVSIASEDLGSGWYKVKVTQTAQSTGTSAFGAYHASADGNTSESISTAYLYQIHAYRSDLGGMVDNPDQPASRASYVPTASTAVYLPRIGHHVYNGNAWVNEGLLAESEARTNLLPYSSNFGNSAWTRLRGAVYSDDIVSPTGQQDGDKYVCNETSVNGMAVNDNVSISAGSDFAGSMYVKKGSTDFCCVICYDGTNGVRQWFNISDGTILSNNSFGAGVSLIQATIEDAGNGWFRVSVSVDTSTANSTSAQMSVYPSVPADLDFDCTATTTYGYIFGAQIEATATSSSYIPTDAGSSVTRAAETFTIPSANLPWPNPNYIGSELVTNGTFDTDSDWIKGTGWTISGGKANLDTSVAGAGVFTQIYQNVTTTAGKVYAVSADFDTLTNVTDSEIFFRVEVGAILSKSQTTTGTKTYYFVAQDSSTTISVDAGSGHDGNETVVVDNISVREIDPLSVSIAMDGRISHRGVVDTFFRWLEDGNNYINNVYWTDYRFIAAQKDGTTYDQVASDVNLFSGDLLEPYNFASRHGSTFLNGAVDGVARTENTTPTLLADLSDTDLELAYAYMGTISVFRVWDRDIGDTGLVEATSPSLEPSLSLTFEGVGTNSFVVNDWS